MPDAGFDDGAADVVGAAENEQFDDTSRGPGLMARRSCPLPEPGGGRSRSQRGELHALRESDDIPPTYQAELPSLRVRRGARAR